MGRDNYSHFRLHVDLPGTLVSCSSACGRCHKSTERLASPLHWEQLNFHSSLKGIPKAFLHVFPRSRTNYLSSFSSETHLSPCQASIVRMRHFSGVICQSSSSPFVRSSCHPFCASRTPSLASFVSFSYCRRAQTSCGARHFSLSSLRRNPLPSFAWSWLGTSVCSDACSYRIHSVYLHTHATAGNRKWSGKQRRVGCKSRLLLLLAYCSSGLRSR